MILQVHPQKTNMNTQTQGWKRWRLLNTAMFGIYAKILGVQYTQ